MATHLSTLSGKCHGQRSLKSYSQWGHKKSDTTEHTHVLYFIFGWPKSLFGFFHYILWKTQTNFLANPTHGLHTSPPMPHPLHDKVRVGNSVCFLLWFVSHLFIILHLVLKFWLCHVACMILVPLPRIEPRSWQWKQGVGGVLTAGQPGNHRVCFSVSSPVYHIF